MRKYEIPDDLLYTKEHEWIRINNSIGECGITDYAQKSLSDIVYVELPEIGREVKKGEIVCTIESVKAVSDIFSPASGEIIEVNTKLKDDPALINTSPYKDGWVFKIKISEKPTDLLSPEEYRKLIQEIEEGR